MVRSGWLFCVGCCRPSGFVERVSKLQHPHLVLELKGNFDCATTVTTQNVLYQKTPSVPPFLLGVSVLVCWFFSILIWWYGHSSVVPFSLSVLCMQNLLFWDCQGIFFGLDGVSSFTSSCYSSISVTGNWFTFCGAQVIFSPGGNVYMVWSSEFSPSLKCERHE